MATEIVTLEVKETFTPDDVAKLHEKFNPPPPGLQSFGWGRVVDENKIVILLNWDSVSHHMDFRASPEFVAFSQIVLGFVTGKEGISFYHTHVQPFPPVKLFEAGIIRVVALAKKPDVSRERFETVRDQVLDKVSKAPGLQCLFHGVKHEDPDNVYIVLTGWDSAESQAAANSSLGVIPEDYIDLAKSSFTSVKVHVK